MTNIQSLDFAQRFDLAERAIRTILEADPKLIEKLSAPERLIAREIREKFEVSQ